MQEIKKATEEDNILAMLYNGGCYVMAPRRRRLLAQFNTKQDLVWCLLSLAAQRDKKINIT